jgi:hypothetical protein
MQLFEVWSKDLELYRSDTLKSFIVDVYASLSRVYRALLQRFRFLFLLPFLIVGLLIPVEQIYLRSQGFISFMLLVGLLVLAEFLVLLLAMNNKELPDLISIAAYWRYACWMIAIFPVIWTILGTLLVPLIGSTLGLEHAFMIFFMAFLFETDGDVLSGILAFTRALKFIVYHVPFIGMVVALHVILYGLMFFVYTALRSCLDGLLYSNFLTYYTFALLSPVLVCFCTTYFIMRMRQERSFYGTVKDNV